ncbi:MAG: hypothetical protein R2771_00090 [Saprospiraceae bacterium]
MKSINYSAPVKAEKSIIINSNIEKVWQVLTNINDWKNWNLTFQNLKLMEKSEPVRHLSGKSEKQSFIPKYILTIRQQTRLTGKVLGVFAIHNWNLIDKKM